MPSATDLGTLSDFREIPIPWNLSERYVPCDERNKVMVGYGTVRLTKKLANMYPGMKYLAENLFWIPRIVFDFDCDKTEELDIRCQEFGLKLLEEHPTHCLYKDGMTSFHLTYSTTKEIPTWHKRKAHLDILGNAYAQLRFYKNKNYNGMEPAPLTDEIWEKVKVYIQEREEQCP